MFIALTGGRGCVRVVSGGQGVLVHVVVRGGLAAGGAVQRTVTWSCAQGDELCQVETEQHTQRDVRVDGGRPPGPDQTVQVVLHPRDVTAVVLWEDTSETCQ